MPSRAARPQAANAARLTPRRPAAQSRFNLDLPPDAPIEFVYLRRRHLVEAARWPRFTMLGQSLGSMVLAAEALWKCCPHVFVDTTGYAFSYPIARLAGATVISYTHYPTISTVRCQRAPFRGIGPPSLPAPAPRTCSRAYASDARTTTTPPPSLAAAWPARPSLRARRSPQSTHSHPLTRAHASLRRYYAAFALAYGLVGRCADLVMVNSTWTRNHINSLWRRPATTHVVFPPCNTGDLQVSTARLRVYAVICPAHHLTTPHHTQRAAQRAAAKGTARHRVAMSVGQFRPEKDHPLQLRALAELHKRGAISRKGAGGVGCVEPPPHPRDVTDLPTLP